MKIGELLQGFSRTIFVAALAVTLISCASTNEADQQRGSSSRFPAPHELTEENLHQHFVPGTTTVNEVRNYLGTPSSVSRSGELSYWNYTIQRLPEQNQSAEMRTLTLVFDYQGILQDADLQIYSY